MIMASALSQDPKALSSVLKHRATCQSQENFTDFTAVTEVHMLHVLNPSQHYAQECCLPSVTKDKDSPMGRGVEDGVPGS